VAFCEEIQPNASSWHQLVQGLQQRELCRDLTGLPDIYNQSSYCRQLFAYNASSDAEANHRGYFSLSSRI